MRYKPTSFANQKNDKKKAYIPLPDAMKYFRRVLYALTPSTFRAHHGPAGPPPVNITSTSWMDGLRGICAVIVVNFHFLFTFTPFAVFGFQSSGGKASNHLAALPPFCLLWDGASSVNVFFAISGFVCSYKALRLMQAGPSASAALLQSLSLSVFRRGLRLYLPVFAMTLIASLLAHVYGFVLTDHMFANHKIWFPGVNSEINLPRFATLWAQLGFWWKEMTTLTNIWEFKPVYPDHDRHLWTVAYEYRMSLHLYVVLLALARCTPLCRFTALCGLALAYAFWHRWEGPLFFLGAALAQWDIIFHARQPTDDGEGSIGEVLPTKAEEEAGTATSQFRQRPIHSHYSWTSLQRLLGYASAVYFMGYPVDNYKHPALGYNWVNALIPSWYRHRENKFPKSIGALILIYLLSSRPRTSSHGLSRRLLESRYALYLGRIMFSLYLVHGTILHAVGYAVPHVVWKWVGGHDTEWKWALGMAVGWIVSMTLSLWAADVFHREVEMRCVRLQRWIEAKCEGRDTGVSESL